VSIGLQLQNRHNNPHQSILDILPESMHEDFKERLVQLKNALSDDTKKKLVMTHLSKLFDEREVHKKIFLDVIINGEEFSGVLYDRYTDKDGTKLTSGGRKKFRETVYFVQGFLRVEAEQGGGYTNRIYPTYAGFLFLETIVKNLDILTLESNKIMDVYSIVIEQEGKIFLRLRDDEDMRQWFFPGTINDSPKCEMDEKLISYVFDTDRPEGVINDNRLRIEETYFFRELNTGHRVRLHEIIGRSEALDRFRQIADNKHYDEWSIFKASDYQWFTIDEMYVNPSVNIKPRLWALNRKIREVHDNDDERMSRTKELMLAWENNGGSLNDMRDFYQDNRKCREAVPRAINLIDNISRRRQGNNNDHL
jgi:hypothetical protein